jgi:hypothetical protein
MINISQSIIFAHRFAESMDAKLEIGKSPPSL